MFCRDKAFVVTKPVIVEAPANDNSGIRRGRGTDGKGTGEGGRRTDGASWADIIWRQVGPFWHRDRAIVFTVVRIVHCHRRRFESSSTSSLTIIIIPICHHYRCHCLLWNCVPSSWVECCFVGANGCIPLTMLVDVYQCCCLLMFVCLPPSRHFPYCKTRWIKNLNLNLNEFSPHRQHHHTLEYNFIAKCQYSCTRNALWCQVH